jgi:predicted enzyme related to lactoylglutathione lyase
MTDGVKVVLYPAKHLDASKALFTALLGEGPSSDSPYYVGWNVAGQDIGLIQDDGKGTGARPSFKVSDIKASLQALLEAGATLVDDVRDVGGGRQVASVTDKDGNMIGLLQDS